MTTSVASTSKWYAVVTGANKGIGLEICRQLAADHCITARNGQRGLVAAQKLRESAGLSDDQLFFHQLDVDDPSSVSSLARYIKTKFGRVDILVNNAGIAGGAPDENVFSAQMTKNKGVGLF